MHKRFYIRMITLVIIAMTLSACQSPTSTELDCTSDKVLCVGLVTGLEGINDKSFTQSAWEGILKAQGDKVADWVRYIETVDLKDYDHNVTILADAGFDIIVTVGDQFGVATNSAAKNFPNTHFIGVYQAQDEVLPNLVGVVFHQDQAGFLAGALAAQITKTNTIAVVLGAETSASTVAANIGYIAGARYINPNINIISSFHPDGSEAASTDPRWGAGAAAKAIQNGADVVFGAGGKTGNGALIETASHPGLYCIGVDSDQWENLPEAHPCLISSAVKLINQSVFEVVKLFKDGPYPSGNYYGSAGLAAYHDFDSVIPASVREKISRIAFELKAGSITTGYNPGE